MMITCSDMRKQTRYYSIREQRRIFHFTRLDTLKGLKRDFSPNKNEAINYVFCVEIGTPNTIMREKWEAAHGDSNT